MRASVYYPHLGTLTLITSVAYEEGHAVGFKWYVRHNGDLVARGGTLDDEEEALRRAERFARRYAEGKA